MLSLLVVRPPCCIHFVFIGMLPHSIPPSLPPSLPSSRDVASVFHIGETVFSSESYPQLYRTWSPYEVTDNLSTDGELCLVAEEVRKLPPKRGRRPKEYKEHAKRVVGFILGSVTEKKKKQEGCAYLAWVAVNEEYQR